MKTPHRKKTHWLVTSSLLTAAVTVFAGFSALDNPVGQVRTRLLPRASISSTPVDGELAHDARIGLPVLRHSGLWRSLRFTEAQRNLNARTPDYTVDVNGQLTVHSGHVVFTSGGPATNLNPLVSTPVLPGAPNGLYATWRALFAYSNESGGFSVAISSNFNTPDAGSGIPSGVITAGNFRYLGSVAVKPEDGRLVALRKIEHRYQYRLEAQILKDTSGPVQQSQISNLPVTARSALFNFEFEGPGSLSGPFGETYGYREAGADALRLNFESHRESGGLFNLSGFLKNCDSDDALQYIMGHAEDPALFVN